MDGAGAAEVIWFWRMSEDQREKDVCFAPDEFSGAHEHFEHTGPDTSGVRWEFENCVKHTCSRSDRLGQDKTFDTLPVLVLACVCVVVCVLVCICIDIENVE